MVVDGSWLYIRSEALGQVAGTGSSWLRMSTGPNDQPTPTAVTGLFALLGLAVSADVGVADTVSGAPAQRFRVRLAGTSPAAGPDPAAGRVDAGRVDAGQIDPGAARVDGGAAQSAPGDLGGFVVIGDWVLVWVGDDGLVRAIEAVVQDPGSGSQSGSLPASGPGPGGSRLVMRYELVEIGGVVDIAVPSAAGVVDVNGGS